MSKLTLCRGVLLFRLGLVLAVLALVLSGTAALATTLAQGQGGEASHTSSDNAPLRVQSFDQLPPGLAPAVARALEEELPASYHFRAVQLPGTSGFEAGNPSQRLQFTLTPAGFQVSDAGRAWTWGLELFRWGYAVAMQPVPPSEAMAETTRLEYRRGAALTEWYRNTVWGLEQGFTLSQPPPTVDGQASPLLLELALSGTLRARLEDGMLLMSSRPGQVIARYTGLHAYDADGQALPAHLELVGQTLRIVVDDSAAQYPVTIDPWVQRAKLTLAGSTGDEEFGTSVAIGGDTIVVGVPGDDSTRGSAYLFQEPGGGWSGSVTEVAKLTASDGEVGDAFGTSVAISGDGGTIAVGVPDHAVGANKYQGSVYVFEEPGGGWSGSPTQSAKLTASDGARSDHLGTSVAVSGDGVSIVAGAPDHAIGGDAERGAAYVFDEPGGGWSGSLNEAAKLTASNGARYDRLGASVAISEDGSTVVTGVPGHAVGENYNQGMAYVFVEPGGGWSGSVTEVAKLTSSDGGQLDEFGTSVAISGDGGTIAVGVPDHAVGANKYQGSVYVFEEPGGGWSGSLTQSAKLTASDGAQYDYLGISVAVSGDGGTVAAGAYRHDSAENDSQGAAYVFDEPGGGWSGSLTESAKLTASDGDIWDYFGSSVGISGDANTIVVGAPQHRNHRGAGYVFVEPGASWSGLLDESAKLSASDGGGGHEFGASVAIGGNTVVVGVPEEVPGGTEGQGAAYVFLRPGGGWASTGTYDAQLTASDGAADDRFGSVVTISSDGSTIVVGAPWHDDGGDGERGAAYVFVEPGNGWSGALNESAKLTASDGDLYDHLGASVAISEYGSAVVAGAPRRTVEGNDYQGVAYLFVESGGGWSGSQTEAAKLTASDGDPYDILGASVGISGDGSTVVAGAPWHAVGENDYQGTAYIFVEPGGGWSGLQTETAQLVASNGRADDEFGGAVAISGDGGTVAVGAPYREAAYAFEEPGGGWSGSLTESAQLTASDGGFGDDFGFSVAISGDGGTVVVGAPWHGVGGNWFQGAVYVFVEPGGWSGTRTESDQLTANDGTQDDELGSSVAISGDGVTVVAGAPYDDSRRGSAYIFESVPEGPALSIAKTVMPDTPVPYHGQVSYSIVLSNSGSDDAVGVSLLDTLPVEVDFSHWGEGQPDGATVVNDQLTWSGTVQAGEAITFDLVVDHVGERGDEVTNTAEYSHASGSGSDDATFTVRTGFPVYLPMVIKAFEP